VPGTGRTINFDRNGPAHARSTSRNKQRHRIRGPGRVTPRYRERLRRGRAPLHWMVLLRRGGLAEAMGVHATGVQRLAYFLPHPRTALRLLGPRPDPNEPHNYPTSTQAHYVKLLHLGRLPNKTHDTVRKPRWTPLDVTLARSGQSPYDDAGTIYPQQWYVLSAMWAVPASDPSAPTWCSSAPPVLPESVIHTLSAKTITFNRPPGSRNNTYIQGLKTNAKTSIKPLGIPAVTRDQRRHPWTNNTLGITQPTPSWGSASFLLPRPTIRHHASDPSCRHGMTCPVEPTYWHETAGWNAALEERCWPPMQRKPTAPIFPDAT